MADVNDNVRGQGFADTANERLTQPESTETNERPSST